MSKHPYSSLPDHCFWSRSHRVNDIKDIDPVVNGGFTINPDMKIATAGSCFAQNIARYLQKLNYNYYVAEDSHPVVSKSVAKDFNYGTFSARYGNIYTARQLLQLVKRAYGLFEPKEDYWKQDGKFIDPFRPNIQPGGFTLESDFRDDREVHFKAVRDIVENSDVFIFTFGLTEGWGAKADGAMFPLAPGVSGGEFDSSKYEFFNFGVSDVIEDFKALVNFVTKKNPSIKFLLTVSPVPLAATARKDTSVITATSYSKSVLRVACEELSKQCSNCFYFPSYEIIQGIFSRGRYYEEDLRQVNKVGVDHVMSLFMKHYCHKELNQESEQNNSSDVEKVSGAQLQEKIDASLQVICEEELLDKGE